MDIVHIISFLLPLIAAILLQSAWSRAAKEWIVVLICLVAALAKSYFTGELTGVDIGQNIVTIIVGSQVLYHAFFKPLGITTILEKVTNLPNRS